MLPSSFQDLIGSAIRAETLEDLHSTCSKVCEALGFDYFLYGAQFPTSLIKPQVAIISGFPSQWWQHYKACGYMKIDPTLTHCAKRLTPLLWKDIGVRKEDTPPLARQLMIEAQDHGLKSGVSFPAHAGGGESAILSLVSQDEHKTAEARIINALPTGQLITGYIHESARRIFANKALPIAKAQLTPREKECLLWAAEGKTTWETAQILNISERTVVFHIQNASLKLNVSNRQHAIARAVSQALITPQLG
ncbi:MAG: autoinducer binding domain-containing protein [Gammaproteobacteria bacterium]